MELLKIVERMHKYGHDGDGSGGARLSVPVLTKN
jgi:hypothetical protein